jgi:hypothetical protein
MSSKALSSRGNASEGPATPCGCATARSRISCRPRPISSPPATSAASRKSRAAHRSRCCIRSSFSTSPTAGQPRMASRASRAERHARLKHRLAGYEDVDGTERLWHDPAPHDGIDCSAFESSPRESRVLITTSSTSMMCEW